MRTVVRGSIVHACPHRDEVDRGTVEFTFDGPAPELHALAAHLAAFEEVKITHEELTARLATDTGAAVTTRWRTAGLEVEVRA